MNCIFTEGCTKTSLTIDGIETIEMNPDNFKNTLKQLIDLEDDIAVLQSIYMHLMYSQGELTDSYVCDECGDTVDTYEVEINNENSCNE